MAQTGVFLTLEKNWKHYFKDFYNGISEIIGAEDNTASINIMGNNAVNFLSYRSNPEVANNIDRIKIFYAYKHIAEPGWLKKL